MEHRESAFIMGTNIEIIIFDSIKSNTDIHNAFQILKDLQNEFSRFENKSAVSQLNRDKTLLVSDRYIKVLELSQQVYKITKGYFNPLINLNNLGYSHSFGENRFEKIISQVNLDFESIDINANIVKLQKNQNLDFGGIVKGYGVDLVKEYFQNKGYKNYIIDAGGDIYISGKDDTNTVNSIAIGDPWNTQDIFALIDCENISVSTSGTYKRKWKIEEKSYHHIITPKKNTHPDDIVSITLLSKNCYISDAYATACIAMGLDIATVFLQEQNIDALIITSDKNNYEIGNLKKYNLEII